MMLNKKRNLKSGNNKDKKRDFKERTRQETKRREKIDENKKVLFNVFHVVLFMKKAKKQE